MASGTRRLTYTLGGQVVAQRTSAGVVTSLHTDHLGSVSAATSSSGAVVNTQSYKPWGEVRTGDLPQTTRDFTGQRRDGTGLLHYNARYYDPGLGLFLSPDTLVPGTASGAGGAAATVGPDARAGLALTVGFHEPGFNARLAEEHRALLGAGFFGRETPPSAGPTNPQALNRYAYVLNNPVRYTDPTGHSACAAIPFPGAQTLCRVVEAVGQSPGTITVGEKVAALIAAATIAATVVQACIDDAGCRQGVIDLVTQGQATVDNLLEVFQAESVVRTTSSGERLRLSPLSDKEVHDLGLHKAKEGRYGATDKIYYDKRTHRYYIGNADGTGEVDEIESE